jgi:hypothetical protein
MMLCTPVVIFCGAQFRVLPVGCCVRRTTHRRDGGRATVWRRWDLLLVVRAACFVRRDLVLQVCEGSGEPDPEAVAWCTRRPPSEPKRIAQRRTLQPRRRTRQSPSLIAHQREHPPRLPARRDPRSQPRHTSRTRKRVLGGSHPGAKRESSQCIEGCQASSAEPCTGEWQAIRPTQLPIHGGAVVHG